MRRFWWLAPFVVTASAAQPVPLTPLRVAVIHVPNAVAIPGSCTVGASPSIITDDTDTFYACVTGAYVAVPAHTAAALAANGSNCSAGQAALGVDASGAAEGCWTPATGTVTSIATSAPLSGGTITTTGTISCPTCATAPASPTGDTIVAWDGTGNLLKSSTRVGVAATYTALTTAAGTHTTGSSFYLRGGGYADHGTIEMYGGEADSSATDPPNVSIYGGNSRGSSSGNLTLSGGSVLSGSATAGSVTVSGGTGPTGGLATLSSGDSTVSADGLDVLIRSGAGATTNGKVRFVAGVYGGYGLLDLAPLAGGTATWAVPAGSGTLALTSDIGTLTPGRVPVASGTHSLVDSYFSDDGTNTTVAGAPGSVPGGNGGTVTLAPGPADGFGVNGTINIKDPESGYSIVLSSKLLQDEAIAFPDNTGTIALFGDIPTTFPASAITMPTDGSTTMDRLDEDFTTRGSSGVADGTLTYVTAVDGDTIAVAAGEGYIRTSNDQQGTLETIHWAAPANIDIPAPAAGAETTRFIGVEYNAGAPRVTTRTTFNWNWYDDFPLARVSYDGTTLRILNAYAHAEDTANMGRKYLSRVFPFQREQAPEGTGGLELGETGTRNFTMSGGKLWHGFNQYTMTSINTASSGSVITYWRKSGGGFNKTAAVTAWPNTQYDEGSGTLHDLASSRYGVLWVYLDIADNQLDVVYGRGNYTSKALAQAEAAPTIPDHLTYHGRLIGRIVFQKSASTAAVIESAWGPNINWTAASVTDISGNAGTVTVADAGSDTTTWPMVATSQTGNLSPATDAGLTYNATTDALTATTFSGALSGNATTATELAADPADCSAGSYALGIVAAGTATCSTLGVPVYALVSGSDFTTSSTTLVDITGLSVALVSGGTYEFEAVLTAGTGADTNGVQVGVQYSSTGSIEAGLHANAATATAFTAGRITAFNTASATLEGSANANLPVWIKGIVVTTGAGNLTIQCLKPTSGTATVYQKSFLRVTRIS